MTLSSYSDKITFGKYKGKTYLEVSTDHPRYIVWVYENLKNHGGVSKDIYEYSYDCLLGVNDEGAQDEDDFYSHAYGDYFDHVGDR